MRPRSALLLLLSLVLSGCVAPKTHTTAWLDRFRHLGGPKGPDAVMMDVALIERPLGDGYLNRTLWTVADEQVIALESRAILEDNGFRIGQIGGITPVELQTLLTSERSCANPRRITSKAGKPAQLLLGPAVAACKFQIERQGQPVPVDLAQAECTLEVTPTLTPDGRTKLRFVPIVQHGVPELKPRPTADRSGWMLAEEKPSQRYDEMAWEVTLAPNEYVVVGGRFERPETLGHQCFLRRDEQTPVQRLLVIRTGRQLPAEDPTAGDEPLRSPSIASQASWTKARGARP